MARKNNKKNRRRAAFYRISKFDYEARENLIKGQLSSKETLQKKIRKSNPVQEVHGLKHGHQRSQLSR